MTDHQDREPAAESSKPAARADLPRLGWRGGLRYLWTQLTSMRTALVLLFALALAAVPGSLLPQRTISPVRVADFITNIRGSGRSTTGSGCSSVYTSPWFSAIYLLLFVSLVGCIIPRIGVYARALRARPPRTPRNLARLPAYATLRELADSDMTCSTGPRTALRQRHYRVDVHEDSVAAERGYLREAGNLVFHVSLLFLLLGVALGVLFGFRGTSVVIVGQGFANNLTQYDDFSAGARFTDADLVPFSVTVKHFDVKFETGPVQRGAARLFRADVEVTDRPGAAPRQEVLEVNQPLNIDGTTVHLIGHGYAPRSRSRTPRATSRSPGRWCCCPRTATSPRSGRSRRPTPGPSGWRSRRSSCRPRWSTTQGPRSSSPMPSTRRCS